MWGKRKKSVLFIFGHFFHKKIYKCLCVLIYENKSYKEGVTIKNYFVQTSSHMSDVTCFIIASKSLCLPNKTKVLFIH